MANVRPDMKPFCRQQSLEYPIEGHYDLVTCIEVLEHMSEGAALLAIKHIASVTDTVLFSSTPSDFAEPTHVNVKPTLYWLLRFADHGFFPDLSYDASYIALHAVLLKKRATADGFAILHACTQLLRLRQALAERESRIYNIKQHEAELENRVAALASEVETQKVRLGRHDELVEQRLREERAKMDAYLNDINASQLRREAEINQVWSQKLRKALQILRKQRARYRLRIEQLRRDLANRYAEEHERTALEIHAKHERANSEQRAVWQGRVTVLEGRVAELLMERQKFAVRFGLWLDAKAHRLFPHGSAQWRLLLSVMDFVRHGRLQRRSWARAAVPAVLHDTQMARGEPAEYDLWLRTASNAQRVTVVSGPMISVILPIYRIPEHVIARTIATVINQRYSNWQLCIALPDGSSVTEDAVLRQSRGDERVAVRRLAENRGISANSNAALQDAVGEFVALLDHDDELTPDALAAVAAYALKRPQVDLWYTDKDTISADSAVRLNPLFKPSWSPEMMYSANYLTHLTAVRTTIVKAIGGWRPETDGAQDWDLFLRASERARDIGRVVGVHYHWRLIEGSTSTGVHAKPYVPRAQYLTIADQLERRGLRAHPVPQSDGGFRISWDGQLCRSVSVGAVLLDLHGDGRRAAHVRRELEAKGSLLKQVIQCGPTIANGGECIGVGGDEDASVALARVLSKCGADVIVFCNTGVRAFGERCLEEIISWAVGADERLAFVSALAMWDRGTVAEAGRVVDGKGRASALFRGEPLGSWGMFGGPTWYRNVRAVNSYAVAVRRDALERAVNGLKERYANGELLWGSRLWFTSLCLELCGAGCRGLVDPYARVMVARDDSGDDPPFDDTLAEDPYFHPAFASVSPLRLRTVQEV
jgi:hypothetical protein